MAEEDDIEFEDEDDTALPEDRFAHFSEAVLYSTDWTVETLLSQLRRENIQLNPNFQRRDAWENPRKSRFIESIIIGLPIPQLVLAEHRDERGKYLVLDGKQRLLSLLKYTDEENGFALSGLEARPDLVRTKYKKLSSDPQLEQDHNAFLNYTIRTVIIRNWPNRDFLYQVFLRLNTGSVKLSPQELRQAMAPGPFTSFADDFSAGSGQLMQLLGRKSPDPRMRDVELLVRHLAFRNRVREYAGRMKNFLDDTCIVENQAWADRNEEIIKQAKGFETAIECLTEVFGDKLARKPESKAFNRALFDALAFYTVYEDVRKAMLRHRDDVLNAYAALFENEEFSDAVESDTAGIPNTYSRLRLWGATLRDTCQINLELPELHNGRIRYQGQ
ncbi:MAG TPA: DUF262 domain-containing protein [Devosiaceae bacterium]